MIMRREDCSTRRLSRMALRNSGAPGGIALAIAPEPSAGEPGRGRVRVGTPTRTGAAQTGTTARLPRWLKPANRVIVALQRLGLAIGTMHLLSVPGRRSGKLHTTPVSPLTVAGHRYIVGGLEGADWVKNARAAGWGILARGRKAERVVLVELSVEERASVLRELPHKVPRVARFLRQR